MTSVLRPCCKRLPVVASFHQQKRFKYKQKWAVMSKKKVPSELALAYFDTYYEPLFGAKLWASTREAMLRDTKKYCALVNNFASAESTIVDLISEAGASDLWSFVGKPLLTPAASSVAGGHRDRRRSNDRLADESGTEARASSPVAGTAATPCKLVDAGSPRRQLPGSDVLGGDRHTTARTTEAVAVGDAAVQHTRDRDTSGLTGAVSRGSAEEDGPVRARDDDEASEQETEFITTPEGFLVPRPRVGSSSLAVDLMEFVPATGRAPTEEELLLEEQHRQNAPTVGRAAPSRVPVLGCEGFRMPHLLKAYIHDVGVEARFRQPKLDDSGFLDYYLMDGASLLPVIALDLSPDDVVLDLCAGPGGKSLAIVQTLLFARLVCVDSSLSRLRRAKDSLTWYTPPSLLESGKVSLMHQDGRLVGSQFAAAFDKVLVDVPCTTDRQVLHEDDNSLFAPGRKQERLKLPELQTQLLCSALEACRPGGTVVYSTCSLSPGQNDAVVEAACTRAERTNTLSKLGHTAVAPSRYAVMDTSNIAMRLNHVFKFWNGCTYGQVVLPTVQANFGPLYFCKIKKLPA